jgi:iron complex outermembrane receptor protein
MKMMEQQIGVARLIVTALMAGTALGGMSLVLPSTAMAQEAAPDAPRDYDIPAGSLTDVLNQLAEQSGLQLNYEAALTEGRTSRGLRGRFTRREALSRILADTGLAPRDTGAASVTIAPATTGRLDLDPLPVRGATVSSEQEREAELARQRALEDRTTIVVVGQFQNSLINRLPVDPIKLPFSLDIIDRTDIEQRAFLNPLDILETLPNVALRQTSHLPTAGQYLVRGLNGTVLTDNRPENDSRGAGRRDSVHIERIEVLKGPTSILLGPVVPGGAINQVTKTPASDSFVRVMARAGSYDTYRAEIDANAGNLFGTDMISARVTAAYENQGSPQKPVETEMFTIRPIVEVNFSPRTRLQASLTYSERKSVPWSSFPVNSDGTVPAQFDETAFIGVPTVQEGRDTTISGEFQHEFLDNLKLVARGAYQNTDFDYQASESGSNTGGFSGPADTGVSISASKGFRDTDIRFGDIQLVGHFNLFGQRQDWVIGGTLQGTKFDSYWGSAGALGTVPLADLPTFVFPVPNFDITLYPFVDTKSKLKSGYGEVTLRPTDRLTIVAGMRYDKYELENLATGQVAQSADDVTGRVGASYEIVDGLNGYVSYAESFIPQSGTIRNGDFIDPETAVNYEAGLKGRLWDGRLRFSAAAFSLTRQNVATADPDNVVGEPAYVIATGEQKHEGFEVSLGVTPTPGFDLDLAYGHVNTKITKVINAAIGQNVGDPAALTPKNTFSAYASYSVQNGPLASLRFGLGVRGISKRPAPRYGIVYDGYTLVDGSISYPISESFSLQLNVLNLLDEKYRDTVGAAEGNPGSGHRFGNPRTAYVTARMQF